MEKIGNIDLVTLVTRKGYQKQVCIIPPYTKIPSHKHPNVRTQITFLHGHAIFTRGGKEIELNSYTDAGRTFIIDPDQEHSAETKGEHCAFMTEQHWLNNEPVRSLHLQWVGEPINKDHEKQLNSR